MRPWIPASLPWDYWAPDPDLLSHCENTSSRAKIKLPHGYQYTDQRTVNVKAVGLHCESNDLGATRFRCCKFKCVFTVKLSPLSRMKISIKEDHLDLAHREFWLKRSRSIVYHAPCVFLLARLLSVVIRLSAWQKRRTTICLHYTGCAAAIYWLWLMAFRVFLLIFLQGTHYFCLPISMF